jgi:hypothetical protein
LEGLPLSWQQLTEKQRAAVKVAAELLLDAHEGLKRRGATASEALDRDRRSQMAFIDGDRGMGKSSVLLSIQALLQDDKLDEKINKTKIDPVVSELHEKRANFVWLDTLDMEPLPRHANILAAILARIGAKAELPGRVDDKRPRMAAAFDELSHFEKTMMDLANLQSTAVLAWAGTEPRRAAQIPPVAYAAEVLASEMAGLEFNRRLGQLLDGLAKIPPATGRWDDPIFILPVDDFDLAPTRCLELLRIVRMVATPRLFFLVAGNTRIAEDALRFQCEGELATLAGAQMASIEASIIHMRAIEIAANNLRKLVPPQQRARLEEMRIEEALKHRPEAGGQTLGEVLEGIDFERNNTPHKMKEKTSLREFFLRHKSDFYIEYSGAVWLGGTPRQVLDRTAALSQYQGLQSGREKGWGESLLRTISAELNREVLEDGRLMHHQRELISSVTDIIEDVRFDFSRVFSLSISIESYKEVPFTDGILRLCFPEPARWLFRASEKQRGQEEKPPPELPVPRRIGSGVTFLYDFAISLWGGYVPYSHIVYDTMRNIPAVEIDWKALKGREVVRWHLPGWWTLREYERFFAHWRKHSEGCSTVDDNALAWLIAQLEVLMDKPFLGRKEKGGGDAHLGRLFAQLVLEEPTRRARKNLREDALVTTILLLTPESGVSDKFASKLLKDSKLVRAINNVIIERVRFWRALTYARIHKTLWQSQYLTINMPAVRLLSAICAEAAIELAWTNLQQASNRFKPAPPKNRLIQINILIQDVHLLEATIKKGYQRDPVVIVEELKEHLNMLMEFKEISHDLSQALMIAIVAIEQPYSTHPIYQCLEGKLAPSAQEIKEIELHDIPQRTDP